MHGQAPHILFTKCKKEAQKLHTSASSPKTHLKQKKKVSRADTSQSKTNKPECNISFSTWRFQKNSHIFTCCYCQPNQQTTLERFTVAMWSGALWVRQSGCLRCAIRVGIQHERASSPTEPLHMCTILQTITAQDLSETRAPFINSVPSSHMYTPSWIYFSCLKGVRCDQTHFQSLYQIKGLHHKIWNPKPWQKQLIHPVDRPQLRHVKQPENSSTLFLLVSLTHICHR